MPSTITKNWYCAMMPVTIDLQGYADVGIINPDRADPHSSNVYRLLHVQALRKHALPDSCVKLLKDSNYTEGFGDCLSKEAALVKPTGAAK